MDAIFDQMQKIDFVREKDMFRNPTENQYLRRLYRILALPTRPLKRDTIA